jgi:chloramphenicol 3-O-phosphotransferase
MEGAQVTSLATQFAVNPVKENLESSRFQSVLASLGSGLGYRQNPVVDGSWMNDCLRYLSGCLWVFANLVI